MRLVHADYDEHFGRYDEYCAGADIPVFTQEYEGGALRDINIYCLHVVLALYGRPDAVYYVSNALGRNAVGTSGVATLRYDAAGLVAVCIASMDSDGYRGFLFQGEKGTIRTHHLPNFTTQVDLMLPDKETQSFMLNRYEHRLCHELEDYRDIFLARDRKAAEALQAQTMLVMETIVRLEQSEPARK